MWQFQLTGTDYKPVGEIVNAASRKVTIPMSKLDQLSFNIRLDNLLFDQISRCEGFIKAYRKGVLVFYGPIITAEEEGTSDGVHLAVTAQGGGWQILNKAYGNFDIGAPPKTGVRTAMDRAVIVKNEIAAFQALFGEMGVSTTALPISSGELVTYTIEPWMPMADLMRVMQSSDNGFDWRMMPIDNFDNSTGLVTGTKHTAFWAAPVLGTQQDEAIWEYGPGTAANIATYRTLTSRETQINGAVSVPNSQKYYSSYPGNALFSTFITSANYKKWGPMIEVVTREDYPDLDPFVGSSQSQALRLLHVNTRSEPRRITVWEPHLDPRGRRMPDYGIDYEVGDTVHGRGVSNNEVRFDGLFRVWGVDFEIQDNGFEKAHLVLEEDAG